MNLKGWIIAIILFLISVTKPTAICQEIDGNHLKIAYVVIDSLDGHMDELHQRAQDWFGITYKEADEVITSNSSSLIVGKYLESFRFLGTTLSFYHRIQVDIQDNRVRVQIWITEQLNCNGMKGCQASEYFYKKNGEQKGGLKGGLDQLLESSRQVTQDLSTYLKTNKGEQW